MKHNEFHLLFLLSARINVWTLMYSSIFLRLAFACWSLWLLNLSRYNRNFSRCGSFDEQHLFERLKSPTFSFCLLSSNRIYSINNRMKMNAVNKKTLDRKSETFTFIFSERTRSDEKRSKVEESNTCSTIIFIAIRVKWQMNQAVIIIIVALLSGVKSQRREQRVKRDENCLNLLRESVEKLKIRKSFQTFRDFLLFSSSFS